MVNTRASIVRNFCNIALLLQNFDLDSLYTTTDYGKTDEHKKNLLKSSETMCMSIQKVCVSKTDRTRTSDFPTRMSHQGHNNLHTV